jgi:hypothetical protein
LGPMLIFGLVLKAGMKSGILYSYCTYIPGIIISGSYQTTDTGIKVCSHLGLGTLVLKFPNVTHASHLGLKPTYHENFVPRFSFNTDLTSSVNAAPEGWLV